MSQQLSITFLLCNPDLSGGDRVIAEQGKRLRDKGHIISIIGVDTYHHSIKDLARSLIKHKRLPEKNIRTDHFDNAGLPVTIIKKPNGPSASDLPDSDIIIATWWETAEWLAKLPSSKGHKVYYIQGYEPWYPAITDAERVKHTYRLPFTQIGVCQWLCDKVDVDSQRHKNQHSILVENGIDLEAFTSPPRSKNKTPCVGYMYSFADFKNPNLALDAVRILQKKIPNLRFISFGAYPETETYPLPDNTEFYLRPTQQKIRDYYASCDVWLLSSDHEGFGLPLLEAMACRTPVVATQAGASPEIVTRETGRLCHERTPEAFANAIEDVLTLSNEEWSIMSENAYKKAQHYSWKRASKGFEAALYKALTSSH